MYSRLIFKVQYDFAGGDAAVKDLYIGVKDIPGLGTLRLGHFKEPFSLEGLTSSKYSTFMEAGLRNVFFPSRNTGIGFHNSCADDRISYAAGFFREADKFGNSDDEAYSVTARLTGLPWRAGDDQLLHLGLAVSHRDTDDGSIALAQRPESHLAEKMVDTGSFDADSYNVYGAELALVTGPFSLQGEYMLAETDLPASGSPASGGAGAAVSSSDDPSFAGWYVYASYWLTGESRKYKAESGTFSRMKPSSSFLDGDGVGAWELALRYSNLDLNDENVMGGELDSITVGVNWHLNPNMRIMLNYVNAEVDDHSEIDGSAAVDVVQTRLQVDF